MYVHRRILVAVADRFVWGRLLLKILLGYSSFIHRLQNTGGGRGERRGVPPLCLAVLADGHLIRGPK